MSLPVDRFRLNTNSGNSHPNFIPKNDSGTKLGDEETRSDGEDALPPRYPLKETSFHFEGVRLTPRILEFVDAYEGKQFSEEIKIQNVGRNPVFVRIGEPNSFIFQMKNPSRQVMLLASGCSIKRTVTYSYHNNDLVEKSQIPIQINGYVIDYPIVVLRAMAEIEVQPSKIDLGRINLRAEPKRASFTIFNKGTKRTRFEIDVPKSDVHLMVEPTRGILKPKDKVDVLVDVMAVTDGVFYKELWVTTNEMSIQVPLLVEVVNPRLEIIHPNETKDFTLIDFQPTFRGTQRAETFILKNYSAETTLFNTLAEVNGGLHFLTEARQIHPTFNMFRMATEEGRLDPFESRILTVMFKPQKIFIEKGWLHQENEETSGKRNYGEHIVFFRIDRVQCIETRELDQMERSPPTAPKSRDRGMSMMQSESCVTQGETSATTLNHLTKISRMIAQVDTPGSVFLTERYSEEDTILRLCLHAKAVEADVLVQPSDLEFEGEIIEGQTDRKVLRITNNSILPVMFKFMKTVNVELEPSEGWLSPKKAVESLVTLKPTCAGVFRRYLKIQVYATSDVVFEKDQALVVVLVVRVPLKYTAILARSPPTPRLGLGIKPTRTDEVGFLKDMVTFGSSYQKPYSAVLLSLQKNHRPEWMKMEVDKVDKVDNAIIAFPNDMPRMFYYWPKEKICRTIFKGLFRYSPPADTIYSLSPLEESKKNEQRLFWKNYLSFMRELRKLNYPNREELKRCLPEYEPECRIRLKTRIRRPESLPMKGSQFDKKSKDLQLFQALVPLSPMHLSRISVEPKFIDFSTVALNSSVQETLFIDNRNPFCISVHFVSRSYALSVAGTSTVIFDPMERKKIFVMLQAKELGRFHGFLTYIINGSHEFKIVTSAVVASKDVCVDKGHYVLEYGNYSPEKAFQPRSILVPIRNPLQTPVKFNWRFPQDSTYHIDLSEGEVPPKTRLLIEIVMVLTTPKSFFSEVTLMSESGSVELIKLVYTNKKVSVDFVTPKVDMKDVPLNLSTNVKPIIRNSCYHEVFFEVMQYSTMLGVQVEPKQGILKPRSFFHLNVAVKIPVIMKFSFDLGLLVHMTTNISVKIMGNVVKPNIRIRPVEVIMRPICVQSFDVASLCVENMGTTLAKVCIDFKEAPEYEIVDGEDLFVLPPGKSTKLTIQFTPEDVARYVFYLPVIINDILGPPNMQDTDTEYLAHYLSNLEREYADHGQVVETGRTHLKVPCVPISFQVTPNLIKVTPLNLNFSFKPTSQFQSQQVVIFNQFEERVTFCIRQDDLGEANGSPFSLEPVRRKEVEFRKKAMKASLARGESLVLEAKFLPKKAGAYTVDVPIFIKDYKDGFVFNYIKMRGELKKPRLYAEPPEVHFPPLPLDVGCDAILTLRAENYCSSETIRCMIWDGREGSLISTKYVRIDWIDVPTVTHSDRPNVFRIRIIFRSDTPVAVRNHLLFLDSGNRHHCSVLLTAISDNSVLTTHAFLSARTFKYKLVRDTWPKGLESELAQDEGSLSHQYKCASRRDMNRTTNSYRDQSCQNLFSIDKGPKLVLQMKRSPTQQGHVSLTRISQDYKRKDSSMTMLSSNKSKTTSNPLDSGSGARTSSYGPANRGRDASNEVTHPNFPLGENAYGEHFRRTLEYAERWVFEVVMRCEEYLTIPDSFQRVRKKEKASAKKNSDDEKKYIQKDFLDFLLKIVGAGFKDSLPRRISVTLKDCTYLKAEQLKDFFDDILSFLRTEGCLLPHVRPEYLLDFESYCLYVTGHNSASEMLQLGRARFLAKNRVDQEDVLLENSSDFLTESWKETFINSESGTFCGEDQTRDTTTSDIMKDSCFEKSLTYRAEVLDRSTFESRSTQAWLDIVIQVFRVFYLTRIDYKNTIYSTTVVGMNQRMQSENVETECRMYNKSEMNSINKESLESNIYTLQERILLTWLNKHVYGQWKILWDENKTRPYQPAERVVNNFDQDLADSVALISVTAAHCPYIAYEFSDVFPRADTLSKMYHNAGKLIVVLRKLNVGLTVETKDIVKPNPVFMIMLLTHLYETLPSLHPRSLICFSSPLTREITRKIQLKNKSKEPLVFQANFIGDHEGCFRLASSTSLIEVKALKSKDLSVIFTAKKIKKIRATLILCGGVVAPNFGKNLAFSLEGEPSKLTETEKFEVDAPLFKVIYLDIPINTPYPETTTYELWYTTNEPEYKEHEDLTTMMKPWSKIRNRKLSRRLFLNKCEVHVQEAKKCTLSVTVCGLTRKTRSFWILFRSHSVGDFFIRIETKTKNIPVLPPITGFFSYAWSPTSECLCPGGGKNMQVLSNSCPQFLEVEIPTRNDPLWDSLRKMFLKTLRPEETVFWAEHFETNIGICLILWLVDVEEEENVVDDFVHHLQTQVTYRLKVKPPMDKYVSVPEILVIPDVRERTNFRLPIHISKGAPPKMKITLLMIAESEKELRNYCIILTSPGKKEEKKEEPVVEDVVPICESGDVRNPCRLKGTNACQEMKKKTECGK